MSAVLDASGAIEHTWFTDEALDHLRKILTAIEHGNNPPFHRVANPAARIALPRRTIKPESDPPA